MKTPKYKIGDEVWWNAGLFNIIPQKLTTLAVYRKGFWKWRYWLYLCEAEPYLYVKVPEKYLFPTKQDLINSL